MGRGCGEKFASRARWAAKRGKRRFFSRNSGEKGKLVKQGVENRGWCGKPQMPVKNCKNGNDNAFSHSARRFFKKTGRKNSEKRETTEAFHREKRSAGKKKQNKRNKAGEKCRLWKTALKLPESWKTCGKGSGQAVKKNRPFPEKTF